MNGYVDVFAPPMGELIGRSYASRSPESWLAMASEYANGVTDARSGLLSTIQEIKALVSKKRYQDAQRIIQRGMADAEAVLRKLD